MSASAVPTIFFKHVRPDQLFMQHLNAAVNAGNAIVSDKTSRSSGTRKVAFKNGAKLRLLKSGIMIHKNADGKIVQCNPDGKRVTVWSMQK